VTERLKMKIQLTQKLTAIISGHGKTRDYLYPFKIIDEPTCPCGKTTEHIIYACERLTKARDNLRKMAIRKNKCPTNKSDLIRRYHKEFTNFINEIQFDKLNVA
jgi:hypothetical protein